MMLVYTMSPSTKLEKLGDFSVRLAAVGALGLSSVLAAVGVGHVFFRPTYETRQQMRAVGIDIDRTSIEPDSSHLVPPVDDINHDVRGRAYMSLRPKTLSSTNPTQNPLSLDK